MENIGHMSVLQVKPLPLFHWNPDLEDAILDNSAILSSADVLSVHFV